MSKFTTGMIAELIAIDKTRKGGVGAEVQELINRLTDGGIAKTDKTAKTVDIRRKQAKKYWDLGFGRELGIDSFKAYLATIPEIPAPLLDPDERFPLLVLVDPRLGLAKTCDLVAWIALDTAVSMVLAADVRHETPVAPFWVRAHDGRFNRDQKPIDCRNACTGMEFAMTAMVGVCLFINFPKIVSWNLWTIDLPGSVLDGLAGRVATLKFDEGDEPELSWGWEDRTDMDAGTGTFRRV